jgi:hypothetical protein
MRINVWVTPGLVVSEIISEACTCAGNNIPITHARMIISVMRMFMIITFYYSIEISKHKQSN